MRKLTKTLALMSLIAPASAYSLGIGGIKVHSGLNQNLRAEITLVTSPGEDVSNISVNLAPPAKFDEAKVPWAFFLSKIKFEPVVKPNGSTVIKVTSNEVLKEPFLDFLLEVNWPKGSLYRQFTVLLEPPDEYQKVAVSHVQNYETFEPAPVPVPRAQPINSAPVKYRRYAPVVHVSRSKNVTRKNDTLWRIAERNMVGDVPSVEQMMIAIYEANPHAFYKDNINALLPDKKLKIPSKNEALNLSQNQALAEFKEQMQAWKTGAAIPRNIETAPADEEEKPAEKQLKLVPPSDATVTDDAATALGNESAASGTDKPGDSKPKEGDANGQDGEAKPETNVIGTDQNAKTEKMLELEKQLSAMQKNLEQKQQQLNTLNNDAKPLPAEPENQTPAKDSGIKPPVIQAPQLPKPPVTKPVTPNPYVEAPEADTTYFWFAGIGGGLLGLIGWLWWRKRKFDEQFDGESMFAPSSMIKPTSSAAKSTGKPLSGTSSTAHGTIEENSFLNEFTASDFEVFDTSHVEIDPVSETDVYLAYGRYQQAEELMRQAIKDQPDNNEYRLKLLEIFCATERKNDFINYATELANAGKKDQAEFWAKVIAMGAEVWPDLSTTPGGELFASEQETAAGNIYTNLTLPDNLDDIASNGNSDEASFDIATFDSAFEDSLMEPGNDPFALNSDANDEISEFDLSSDTEELQNNDSIDFDLGQLSATINNSNATPAKATEKVQDDVSASISLNKPELSLEDNHEQEIPAVDSYQLTEDADEFNFDDLIHPDDDLASLLDSTSENTLAQTPDTDSTNNAVTDDFDFDLDFDMEKSSTDSNIHYFDSSESTFEFIDLDEMETKLDLAKAYIDMGDSEAAKEIIAEILDKGNTEQVQVARNLFDSLAAE